MDLILSDADTVCKENPWPWTPGYGRVYYYRGGPDNSMTSAGFLKDANGVIIDIGDCSTPILTDWNSDGKLDLILGTYGPHDASNNLFYEWRIYLNTGTESQYEFASYRTIEDQNGNAILASNMVIKDIDRDGKQDIIFGLTGETELAWYRNIGSATHPEFNNYETIVVPIGATFNPTFFEIADITGDGVLDLIYVDMYYPYYCKGVEFATANSPSELAVQPNWQVSAVNRTLTVSFSTNEYENCAITLYDIRGRVLSEQNIDGTILNLELSTPGWYAVSIVSDGVSQVKSLCIE